MASTDNIAASPEFRLYLGSTAFSGIAFAMQQLLLAWILIGILELPAAQVGVVQAAVGIPGIFLMLLGGARADGVDPRSLLIRAYSLAPLLPLFLVAIIYFQQLSIATVLLWALGMSVVVSYSSPAQQAILNRVAGDAVQQAVSAASAIGFIVQMLGLAVAGMMGEPTNWRGSFWLLAATVGAGGAAYLVTAVALRMPELRWVAGREE